MDQGSNRLYTNFWIHYLSIMSKVGEQIKALGFYQGDQAQSNYFL